MAFVQLAIQGESHLAVVNTDQICFISQGIYGASVHFASGEYLVCNGDLEEVTQKLFGKETSSKEGGSYVIEEPRTA